MVDQIPWLSSTSITVAARDHQRGLIGQTHLGIRYQPNLVLAFYGGYPRENTIYRLFDTLWAYSSLWVRDRSHAAASYLIRELVATGDREELVKGILPSTGRYKVDLARRWGTC